jgi:hypothetical protein
MKLYTIVTERVGTGCYGFISASACESVDIVTQLRIESNGFVPVDIGSRFCTFVVDIEFSLYYYEYWVYMEDLVPEIISYMRNVSIEKLGI